MRDKEYLGHYPDLTYMELRKLNKSQEELHLRSGKWEYRERERDLYGNILYTRYWKLPTSYKKYEYDWATGKLYLRTEYYIEPCKAKQFRGPVYEK